MPTRLPVPWIQWNRFRVGGTIREKETGRPVPGLVVCAFDEDHFDDDFLGECETDEAGKFEIQFTDADFKDFLESKPDLYLSVFVPGNDEPIHDTSHAVRKDAGEEEFYDIEIPEAELTGLAKKG